MTGESLHKNECRLDIWKLVVVFVFVFAWNVNAHTGHKKKQEPQTTTVQTQTNTTVSTRAQEHQVEMDAAKARDAMTIMKEAMPSHLHNKIIHFPLALGLAGAILILLGYKWPHYQSAARFLLLIAAASAIAAYFTGRAQEEPFEEGEMKSFLEWHRTLGITTGVVLWIGVLLTSFSQYKKLLLFYAIGLLILISATGFLGGILAHG